MKLSEATINILKNYSTINPSILVKPGSVLQTIAPVSRAIFAKASVEESFPQQIALHELSTFLGVLSLFKDPELEFHDKQVVIKSDKQSVSYDLAEPTMVISPPDREFVFPADAEIEFDITPDDTSRLIRAAGVLKLPHVAIWSDKEHVVKVSAFDQTAKTKNTFDIVVGTSPHDFKMILQIDNLVKIMNNAYNVKVSSKGMACFQSDKMTYYIACEANSKFTKGE
jgi:hypothetical protein